MCMSINKYIVNRSLTFLLVFRFYCFLRYLYHYNFPFWIFCFLLFFLFMKNIKKSIKNYSTVFLFPIPGKIFEMLLHNNMHSYFTKNDFLFHNQSGFKTEDLFINQLLSVTPENQKSFDDGWKVRGVFLIYQKHLTMSGNRV